MNHTHARPLVAFAAVAATAAGLMFTMSSSRSYETGCASTARLVTVISTPNYLDRRSKGRLGSVSP